MAGLCKAATYRSREYRSVNKDVDGGIRTHTELFAEFIKLCFLLVVHTDCHCCLCHKPIIIKLYILTANIHHNGVKWCKVAYNLIKIKL